MVCLRMLIEISLDLGKQFLGHGNESFSVNGIENVGNKESHRNLPLEKKLDLQIFFCFASAKQEPS